MTKNAAVEAMYCSLVLMLIYMLWPVAGVTKDNVLAKLSINATFCLDGSYQNAH